MKGVAVLASKSPVLRDPDDQAGTTDPRERARRVTAAQEAAPTVQCLDGLLDFLTHSYRGILPPCSQRFDRAGWARRPICPRYLAAFQPNRLVSMVEKRYEGFEVKIWMVEVPIQPANAAAARTPSALLSNNSLSLSARPLGRVAELPRRQCRSLAEQRIGIPRTL